MSTVVGRLSADYPEALEDLSQPPEQLFLIGDAALLREPLVAIVGTRNATSYGLRAARSLTSALTTAGICVVSGMARGIDAAVHRTALEKNGKTIAVLGTGIDVPYPVGHAELHRVIGEKGLVLSELGPGTRAHKGAFPKRNRIIAALARLTIVVEAGAVSGALNTTNHALEIGRPIAAIPGPIDSPQSLGCNNLIRDGAAVIASIADALALAGVPTANQPQPVHLGENDSKVWSALGGVALSIDTLATRASLTTRDCLAAVTSLELSGMVECLVTGEVRRR